MKHILLGFQLIIQPGIKRYVILPLCINIALFIGLFFLTKYFFHEASNYIMHLLPAWLQWLQTILWVMFFIGFFLIILYSFVTIANIIASPFNTLLAEKVAIHLTGKIPPEKNFKDFMKDIPRTITRQLSILGYFFPRAIVLLLLFFIPIIQIIAPFIWFMFNAWLMTLQYMDYPSDNARVSFTEMRHILSQKRAMSLGFGIRILILSMIPFLNFIVMPASVAGATSLWLKEYAHLSK